jgi:hypothetical protein
MKASKKNAHTIEMENLHEKFFADDQNIQNNRLIDRKWQL